ncbi:MAG: hypothetical protein LIP01_06030 [Tannerellaceae bacterium]|nr:hypothetical protein [Tannerellaceae bacterium]
MYFKAKMLVAGEGVVQNLAEGVELMCQAAEKGNRDAQYEVGNYYLVGKGVDVNEDMAMEWFEKAADNGHKKVLQITGRSRRK